MRLIGFAMYSSLSFFKCQGSNWTAQKEMMQTMNIIAEEPDDRPITLLDKWRFVMQAIPDKRLTAGRPTLLGGDRGLL
jgi:hypothetical protein